MSSKYLLFTGIISLSVGIILRALNKLEFLGLALIIFGVICKAIYIIAKIKSGEYKPGKELFYLSLGLLLFFAGMYWVNSEQSILRPIYFIVLGITLKIVFIIRFIQIIRSGKKSK